MPPKKTATASSTTTTKKTASSTTGAKKASTAGTKKASTKGGASSSKAAAAKAPAYTPEQHAAATTIQRFARGFVTRRRIKKQKERAAKQAEEMESLRAQAYLAEVAYQRKQEEKRRKEAEAERKMRKEESRIKKAMLEAAFDDEVDEVEKLIGQVAELFGPKPTKKVFGGKPCYDVEDANGNTPLSEAAAAGAEGTVKLLLSLGADPNSKGEFGRTPLFRACFMGKQNVLQALLDGGGDPRVANTGGERPEHIASTAAIKDVITGWDTSVTDSILRDIEQSRNEAEAQERFEAQKAVKSATQAVETAQVEYDSAQKNMRKSHEELEKRIYEYDTVVGERKPQSLCEAALGAVKDAEATNDAAKKRLATAREAMQEAKLAYRTAREEESEEQEEVGQRIELQELDDVIIRDVGNKLGGSGALVIDTSGQASVFFRYADTNYVNACSRKDIEPNRLRRSLLGAIRYGKPCIIDTMGVDLWDEICNALEGVQPNLVKQVLNGEITKPDNYMRLVRKEDGEEYDPNKFQDARIKSFRSVVLTTTRQPETAMVESGLKTFRINIRNR